MLFGAFMGACLTIGSYHGHGEVEQQRLVNVILGALVGLVVEVVWRSTTKR
jgi:hypothetical protein